MLGRNTQGVKLISLSNGERLVGLERIVEDQDELDEEGLGARLRPRRSLRIGGGSRSCARCLHRASVPFMKRCRRPRHGAPPHRRLAASPEARGD